MNRRLRGSFLLLACFAVCAPVYPRHGAAQDDRRLIFQDALLENLNGDWKMSGKVMDRPVEYRFKADWTLNHQFLRLHMKDVNNPPAYEALVFIGYDHANPRYVAHWLDNFGGRASETLGFGARSGTTVRFMFDYPEGAFRNTFTWQPGTKTWHNLLERQDKTGKWTIFAEYDLRRPETSK